MANEMDKELCCIVEAIVDVSMGGLDENDEYAPANRKKIIEASITNINQWAKEKALGCIKDDKEHYAYEVRQNIIKEFGGGNGKSHN